MYVRQRTQLTGTNSRTLGRIDPLLGGLQPTPRDSCMEATAAATLILPGDHTWMDTPVPIPNTAVKHPGPMVVR